MMIDLVAVAARVGMTLYICEHLNISSVPSDCTPHLARLLKSSTDRPIPTIVRLTIPRHQEDSNVKLAVFLGSSSYRQTLNEYLRRDEHSSSDGTLGSGTEDGHSAQNSSLQTHEQWAHFAFAETYLLFHCYPQRIDIARVLLQAGANPMVQFLVERAGHQYPRLCFWHEWLKYLHWANGRFQEVRPVIISKVALETTIALIVHPANFNFWTRPIDNLSPNCNIKRGTPHFCRFGLETDATAIFVLEDIFDGEPDFLEFATAMEPFVQFPTRKLLWIAPVTIDFSEQKSLSAPLTSEHCDTLWPLVEQAERNRDRKDVEVLEAAMEQIWKAYQVKKNEGAADLSVKELIREFCK